MKPGHRPARIPHPGPRLRLRPYIWHIIAVGIFAPGILLLAAAGLIHLSTVLDRPYLPPDAP